MAEATITETPEELATLFKALAFACVPAWLFPGRIEVPAGGPIGSIPGAPITPSPTIGHRNAATGSDAVGR